MEQLSPCDLERLKAEFGVDSVLVSSPQPAGLDCHSHDDQLTVCRSLRSREQWAVEKPLHPKSTRVYSGPPPLCTVPCSQFTVHCALSTVFPPLRIKAVSAKMDLIPSTGTETGPCLTFPSDSLSAVCYSHVLRPGWWLSPTAPWRRLDSPLSLTPSYWPRCWSRSQPFISCSAPSACSPGRASHRAGRPGAPRGVEQPRRLRCARRELSRIAVRLRELRDSEAGRRQMEFQLSDAVLQSIFEPIIVPTAKDTCSK